ncbi:autotransporter adhesin Ag43, partial [Escherichia coli]|nr:autotransporter adhesin Ag43 [Escherichia coli]
MKRHLNTSYRLVWNHITGTLVVASELARSRGKRTGVAVALSLAAVTSVPALAADTVVQAGETVNGGTLTNHDNQIVFGTTNGMTISTGLEYGTDNEANTGGQWVQDGGTASNTTISSGGLQFVGAGGKATDTIINEGGGQSLKGLALNTTLNGGEQWMHEGAIATGTVINDKGWQVVKPGAVATDTVVNTGAEGGPDAENGDTGQFVRGNAVRTTINKNGRQIVTVEGTANTTVVYAGGDQTVHGHALDTTLNGGNQYVHNGGTTSDTVVNSDGWQIIKEGGLADFTTVNQKGKLQVNAGGTATNVTLKQGGALVTSTAATVTGTHRLGHFSVGNGMADNVVLENGGRLDVLEGHSAWKTLVDDGGTLAVSAGGKATGV